MMVKKLVRIIVCFVSILFSPFILGMDSMAQFISSSDSGRNGRTIWGLLQMYGYVPSGHSLYALTGSFYNPGPYSGFLAMCMPVALHGWLKG